MKVMIKKIGYISMLSLTMGVRTIDDDGESDDAGERQTISFFDKSVSVFFPLI
jgi:hypothetical protein